METRDKKGKFLKGFKHTPETKKKIGLYSKLNPNKGTFKKKMIPWNKGRTGYLLHSQESRLKISIASKNRKREKISEKHRKNLSLSHMGQTAWNKNKGVPKEHKLLAHNFRSRVLKILGKKNSDKSSRISLLGCSVAELKTYLENKFQKGMSWENHGRNGWHIDHIKPLSRYKLEDIEQGFHYLNLQLLWARDNLIKSNKI